MVYTKISYSGDIRIMITMMQILLTFLRSALINLMTIVMMMTMMTMITIVMLMTQIMLTFQQPPI